jgi:hypothetical protein
MVLRRERVYTEGEFLATTLATTLAQVQRRGALNLRGSERFPSASVCRTVSRCGQRDCGARHAYL